MNFLEPIEPNELSLGGSALVFLLFVKIEDFMCHYKMGELEPF